MKKSRFCKICLRTDIGLRLVDRRLSECHDELCDFNLETLDPQYCMECAHILKKVYNFKIRCKNAIIVFKKWTKTKNKMPANRLYTLVPQSTLGLWTSNNSAVCHMTHDDLVEQNEGSSTNIELSDNVSSENDVQTEKYNPKDCSMEETSVEDLLLEIIKEEDHPYLNNSEHIAKTNRSQHSTSSISNDHCYTKSMNKISQQKMSRDKLANKSFSDDDFHNDHDMEQQYNTEVIDDHVGTHTLVDNEQISDDHDAGTHTLVDNEQISNDHDAGTHIHVNYEQISDDHYSGTHTLVDNEQISNDHDAGTHTHVNYEQISNDNEDGTHTLVDNEQISDDNDDGILPLVDNEQLSNDHYSGTHTLVDNEQISDDNEDGIHILVVSEQTIDDQDYGTLKHVGEEQKGKRNRATAKNRRNTEISKLASVKKPKLKLLGVKNNRVPFSKEGLIAMVQDRFDSCGDIEIKPGTLLDKQLFIECLNDKITMTTLKFLWGKFSGKNEQSLIQKFGDIQSRYKNDPQYKTVFDIEYLNTEEKILQEFQNRKTYKSYVDAEFKCDLCYSGFKHKKVLDYHNKISHDDDVEGFACSVCGMKQKGKRSLRHHKMNSHEAVYKCKLCPMITHCRGTMINHYDQHMGKEYTCVKCGTIYGSHSAYETHKTMFHRSGKHNCETCGRCFASATSLQIHNSRSQSHKMLLQKGTLIHEKYNCDECDITFKSQKSFNIHVRRRHGLHTVGKRGQKRATHKMVVVCRECNATGGSYGWLTLHYRLEHPDADMSEAYADKRTHLCHVCGKGYGSKFTLRDHIQTHTDVQPFACDFCPKRFPSAFSLSNHRDTHLPPSRACPHCGKLFRLSSSLYAHIQGHIGNRRYKCDICGKGFVLSTTLNEHVRGVHLRIGRSKRKHANTEVNDTVVSDTGVNDAEVTDTRVNNAEVGDTRSRVHLRITRNKRKLANTEVNDAGVSGTGVNDGEVSNTGVNDGGVDDTRVSRVPLRIGRNKRNLANTEVNDAGVTDPGVNNAEVGDTRVSRVHLRIGRNKRKLANAEASDTGVNDGEVSNTGVNDTKVSRKRRKKKATYKEGISD